MTFDGQSDTGQVESVEAETADGGSTLLPRGTVQYRGPDGAAGEQVLHSLDVRDGVEAIVYDYLDWTHAGWEDSEGAEGVFTFEVMDRVVRVRVRERLGEVVVPEVEF